jgi:uracil-DNA glycosylase family 4
MVLVCTDNGVRVCICFGAAPKDARTHNGHVNNSNTNNDTSGCGARGHVNNCNYTSGSGARGRRQPGRRHAQPGQRRHAQPGRRHAQHGCDPRALHAQNGYAYSAPIIDAPRASCVSLTHSRTHARTRTGGTDAYADAQLTCSPLTVVFGRGNARDARLVIVGESPGRDDNACGTPFANRHCAACIDNWLGGTRIDSLPWPAPVDAAADVYYCHALKLRPEDARHPTTHEIRVQTPALRLQLCALAHTGAAADDDAGPVPLVVWCMGRFAAMVVLTACSPHAINANHFPTTHALTDTVFDTRLLRPTSLGEPVPASWRTAYAPGADAARVLVVVSPSVADTERQPRFAGLVKQAAYNVRALLDPAHGWARATRVDSLAAAMRLTEDIDEHAHYLDALSAAQGARRKLALLDTRTLLANLAPPAGATPSKRAAAATAAAKPSPHAYKRRMATLGATSMGLRGVGSFFQPRATAASRAPQKKKKKRAAAAKQ